MKKLFSIILLLPSVSLTRISRKCLVKKDLHKHMASLNQARANKNTRRPYWAKNLSQIQHKLSNKWAKKFIKTQSYTMFEFSSAKEVNIEPIELALKATWLFKATLISYFWSRGAALYWFFYRIGSSLVKFCIILMTRG